MDNGHAISEECREPKSDIQGTLSEITYRDYVPHKDIKIIRYIMCEYWSKVNREDLSGSIDLPVKEQVISILKVDSKVLNFIEDGIKIRLAFFGNDVVGLMLYRLAFDTLLAIDGIYVLSGFRRHGISEGMINSLEKPISRLFFQTHLKNRPSDMFKALEHMRFDLKKISRNGDIITWESTWRNRDGNT